MSQKLADRKDDFDIVHLLRYSCYSPNQQRNAIFSVIAMTQDAEDLKEVSA